MGVCYPTYVSLLPFRYLKSASIQWFRALTYKFLDSEQLGLGLIGCSFPSAFLTSLSSKGVAERGSRTKGRRGGVRPKAKKKIVTPPILIVEVVVDVPKEFWMVLL